MGTIKFNNDDKNKKTKKAADKVESNNDNLINDETLEAPISKPLAKPKCAAVDTSAKEEPALLFEDVLKREECAKHFCMSDGTYKAFYYGTPVHYFNENTQTLESIDNTLEHASDSGQEDDFDGYINKAHDLKVKFAKSINSKNTMSVQKGEHKLIWKLLGKTDTNNRSNFEKLNHSEAQVIKAISELEANSEQDNPHYYTQNLTSEIRYNEFIKDVDLQYILNGNGVKENIIVKERLDNYEFAFKLKVKNLELKLADEQKSIEFFASKTNEDGVIVKETIFIMPAPHMSDSVEGYSEDIIYHVEDRGGGEYLFKLVPSREWLNSQDRVFPVNIDPSIFAANFQSSLNNQLVLNIVTEGPQPSVSTGLVYVSGGGAMTHGNPPPSMPLRTVNIGFRIPQFMRTEPERIISSRLCFQPYVRYRGRNQNGILNVQRGAEGENSFNNTTLGTPGGARRVISVELNADTLQMTNNAIRMTGENALFIDITRNSFLLEVAYNDIRNAFSDECHTSSIGRAGTGLIDLSTGDLRWVHENISLGGLKLPMQIFQVYDKKFARNGELGARRSGESVVAPFNPQISMGHGWKTNLHQYLVPFNRPNIDGMSSRPMVYIDHLGREHLLYNLFIPNWGMHEMRSESGHISMQSGAQFRQLRDRVGNTLVFGQDMGGERFALTQIVDSSGNRMKINYEGNRIQSVEDGAGRVVIFNYNNSGDRLETIIYNGNITRFIYDSGRLRRVTYPDNQFTQFEYDSSNNTPIFRNDLTLVRDQKGHAITYTHTANRISIVENTNVNRIRHNDNIELGSNDRPQVNIDFANRNTFIHTINANFRTRYRFDGNKNLRDISEVQLDDETLIRELLRKTFSVSSNGNITTLRKTTPTETMQLRFDRNSSQQIRVSEMFPSGFSHREGKIAIIEADTNGNITREQSEAYAEGGHRRFNTDYAHDHRGLIENMHDSSSRQQTNNFDENGNIEQSQTQFGRLVGGNAKRQRFEYTHDGNFLYKYYDYTQRSSELVTTIFNHTSGKLERISLDNNHVIDYTYDSMTGLINSATTRIDNNILVNRYFYTLGCLTRLEIYDTEEIENATPIRVFEFEYDGFGICTKTTMNGHTLSEKSYSVASAADEYENCQIQTTYKRGNVDGVNKDFTQKIFFDRHGRPDNMTESLGATAPVYNDNVFPRLNVAYDNADRPYIITQHLNTTDNVKYQYSFGDQVDTGFTTNEVSIVDQSDSFIHKKELKTSEVINQAEQLVHNAVHFTHSELEFGQLSPNIYNYKYSNLFGDEYTNQSEIIPNPMRTLETMLEQVDSSVAKITYGYDNNGRVQTKSYAKSSPDNFATTPTFASETYRYRRGHGNNLTNQVDRINYAWKNGNTAIEYMYNSHGRLTYILSTNVSIRYQYDSVGRLIREDNRPLNVTRVTEYNALGKIKAITTSAFTIFPNFTGTRIEYEYDNERKRLIRVGENPITTHYDNLGNPSDYKGNLLEWERVGDLTRFGNTTFSYDMLGRRLDKRRRHDNQILSSYFSHDGVVHGECRVLDKRNIVYNYDAGGICGMKVSDMGNFHFTKNVFGDIIGILNDEGELVARYEYDAWGNQIVIDPSGAIDPMKRIESVYAVPVVGDDTKVGDDTIAGGVLVTSLPDFIGNINPWRWRGQYFDVETGLYYMGGRYYDPEIGRVINEDLDDAGMSGDYGYEVVDAREIFPVNHFNPATWGYPEARFPDRPELPIPYSPASLSQTLSPPSTFRNWWNNLPSWARWTIGAVAVVGLAAATVVTGGLAGLAAAKAGAIKTGVVLGAKAGAAKFVAGGAKALGLGFIGGGKGASGVLGAMAAGSILSATSGAIFGGIQGGWDGAASGFGMGAISGALGGAVGKAIGTGTTLASKMGANALASGGMSMVTQMVFTGKVDWGKVGIASIMGIFAPFGFLKPATSPLKDALDTLRWFI